MTLETNMKKQPPLFVAPLVLKSRIWGAWVSVTVLGGSGPRRISKFLGEELLWQREESLSQRENSGVQLTMLWDSAGYPAPPGPSGGAFRKRRPSQGWSRVLLIRFRSQTEQDALLGRACFSCCQNIAKILFLSNKNENNNMQILFPFFFFLINFPHLVFQT